MMFDPNIQSPFWGEIILGLRANELTNKLSYTTPQKNTPSTYTCIPPPPPISTFILWHDHMLAS